ncbi:hypothetical protein [Nostoc sp.]|uniref:hypothetical protein n=1 Tax=Nostoc sp. TaxID=1180 RepID=UPI002FF5FFE4
MSNITLEQEELAVITELDDEKTVALIGGSSWKPPIKWPKPTRPEFPDFPPLKGRGGLIGDISLLITKLVNIGDINIGDIDIDVL